MKYARLGNSGLIVSKLAWGASNLGTPFPEWAKAPHLDEAAAGEAVAVAVDHGVNFFDTADHYSDGEAEEVLGRALKGRREHVVISSKVGMRFGPEVTQSGLSRRHILASIDGSLKRLGTDWLDVYIAHRPDPHTPLEETLQAFDETVRAGKVRYIGYSNWPAWLAAKAVGLQRQHGWAPFVTAQMYYSLADRGLEHETIPFCLDAGIGVMAWSPLAAGLLSGKYTSDDPAGGSGRLSYFNLGPLDSGKGAAVVDVLKALAADRGVAPAALAIAWVIEQPSVSTALIGISRVEQMTSNLEAASITLTLEELALLDAASRLDEPYPNWFVTRRTDAVTRDALAGVKP